MLWIVLRLSSGRNFRVEYPCVVAGYLWNVDEIVLKCCRRWVFPSVRVRHNYRRFLELDKCFFLKAIAQVQLPMTFSVTMLWILLRMSSGRNFRVEYSCEAACYLRNVDEIVLKCCRQWVFSSVRVRLNFRRSLELDIRFFLKAISRYFALTTSGPSPSWNKKNTGLLIMEK